MGRVYYRVMLLTVTFGALSRKRFERIGERISNVESQKQSKPISCNIMLTLIILSIIASVLSNIYVVRANAKRNQSAMNEQFEAGVREGVRLAHVNRKPKLGQGLKALFPKVL